MALVVINYGPTSNPALSPVEQLSKILVDLIQTKCWEALLEEKTRFREKEEAHEKLLVQMKMTSLLKVDKISRNEQVVKRKESISLKSVADILG